VPYGVSLLPTLTGMETQRSRASCISILFKGSFLVDEKKDGMFAPKKVKASSQLQ
jgi:hypothetical protein